MSTRPDLLDLHDNLTRRLRNLETGVHPLRAIADFYESIPPTLFPKDAGGAGSLTQVGLSTQRLRYQKRAGIGSLMGAVNVAAAGGGLWGTLPEAMRPTVLNAAPIWISDPPYIMRITIAADGQVHFAGAGTATSATAYADGVTWPVA